jgi:hypothetical protein
VAILRSKSVRIRRRLDEVFPNFSQFRKLPSTNSSNLLILLERVKGIEPSYSAWKAAALPLSYTRSGGEYAVGS